MSKIHQPRLISQPRSQTFSGYIQLYGLLALLTLSLLLLVTARTGWTQAATGIQPEVQPSRADSTATGGGGAAGRITVTPYGNIYASTWNDNSFALTNSSTGGQRITAVAIDLRSALLPDLVFDPNGTAGDQYAKGLTPNDGAAAVGYSGNLLSGFHNGTDDEDGFDRLAITFTDFGPGETFGFSIDIDPTSIKGLISGGPQEAGSVSGLELTGAMVTLDFSDGSSQTVALFHRKTSNGGGENLVRAGAPAQPTIAFPGIATPTTLFQATQSVRVQAPSGSNVRLFHVEAGLFEQNAGGYDIDPFEANSVVGWQEYGGTVGSSGVLDLAVTLTKTLSDAGLHYFVAAVEADDGMTGLTSNVLVVEYAPEGNSAPRITPIPNQTHQEGQAVDISVTATDPDERPQLLRYSAANLPPGLGIDQTSGHISGTLAAGAAAGSPYTVTVTVSDGADSTNATFTWRVTLGNTPSATPTASITPTAAPSVTPTMTPTPTATPGATASVTPTATPGATATVTPTASISPTAATPMPTVTVVPTPGGTPVGTRGEIIYLPVVQK